MSLSARKIVARHDPALRARVVHRVPLVYVEGADAALDRPAHVRAGSGLAWIGDTLAVIQDDANFVALADPATGRCRAVTLPAGAGGLRQFDDVRGNKRFKLDVEACVAVPSGRGGEETLAAFGSGSTPMREQVLLLRDPAGQNPRMELVDAPAFYARLREAAEFAGSELNVEAAAWRGRRILLLNRGNGAAVDDRHPVDAVCAVDWPALRAHMADPAANPAPAPESILQYDLGAVDGWRLTFTDAAAFGKGLIYTATAEASPNTVDDGPVAGSALGIIGPGGAARWTVLEDAAGGRFDGKVEGVARGTRPGTVLVIIDRDDPYEPSELCEVEMSGDWPV